MSERPPVRRSGATLSRAAIEQRRMAATTHGAHSAPQIRARARAHRRRFLRQIGLRASDLDAIAAAYLDGWARALAKVDLFDNDEGRNGELREYFSALNSARLWLAKLEARLAVIGLDRAADDPFERLNAHLAAKAEAA